MIWGALKAFQEDDLKRILAYTTISALGILFMMIGLGGEAAVNAAMVYVLAHALYKCDLFMAAGNIDHQTGTRRISQLSDLGRKMPVTTVTVALALASMAGVLPLLGFVGKELLYDALYHTADPFAMVYLVLLFLAGALFTAVSADILYNAFFKTGKLQDHTIREGHLMLIFPPLLLAAISLLTGIAPGWTIAPLLKWSAASIHDFAPSMKLKTMAWVQSGVPPELSHFAHGCRSVLPPQLAEAGPKTVLGFR
jgi:multicomponent Na+:H+ antiporter subunit A